MLTTHQITAVVLGILLPMILLIGFTYASALEKGKVLGAADGYQAGLRRQSEHVDALQADIGTLNTRLTNMSEALANAKEGHELNRRHLLAVLEHTGAVQDEALRMLPRVLTDTDLAHLSQARGMIAGEANRFRKTGSTKANRAHVIEQHLVAIHARATASDWRHPDTDLIEWLDSAASVHADEEHGELRFPLAGNCVGYPHVRDMIRTAQQQDEECLQNHQASLEAVA